MATPSKDLIKRLMSDLAELKNCPVANVSAAPLKGNMLEWHCNIRQDETIYHLILFFPKDYPYSTPSAEFVSKGYTYREGSSWTGKKGTRIYLDVLSDPPRLGKKLGWSPAYTVKTILINAISFLTESDSYYYYYLDPKLSKEYECPDCGHTYKEPFPALDENVAKYDAGNASNSLAATAEAPEITDYISKESLTLQKPQSVDDLYGYGLVVSGPSKRPALTTPCEFLSRHSFYGMKRATNGVCSVLKEDLSFFLPLFIHPKHGSEIKEEFEKCLEDVIQILPPRERPTCISEKIISVIPNLMSATVVAFSRGTQHTSDNSLNGYFALHRLFLWALETYPELQNLVDSKLEKFIESGDNRTKETCPNIGELLMLLAASKKFTWQDLADAYLDESFKRNVMWYVKEDHKLGLVHVEKTYRLQETLKHTAFSRKLLAFQVLFLEIALPKDMSREEIIKRYDGNMGFPSKKMVEEMKAACFRIENEMKTFKDWYEIIKIPAPSEDELFIRLVESVYVAIITPGYHWSYPKGAGGWELALKWFRGTQDEKYVYQLRNAQKLLPPDNGKEEGRSSSKDQKEMAAEASGMSTSAEAGGMSTSAEAGGMSTSAEAGGMSTSAEAGGMSTAAEAGGMSTAAEAGGMSTAAEAGGMSTSAEAGGMSTAAEASRSKTGTAPRVRKRKADDKAVSENVDREDGGQKPAKASKRGGRGGRRGKTRERK